MKNALTTGSPVFTLKHHKLQFHIKSIALTYMRKLVNNAEILLDLVNILIISKLIR